MLDGGSPVVPPPTPGLVEVAMPTRRLAAVILTLLVVGVRREPPHVAVGGQSRLTIGAITPASGGTVTTTGSLPGAMIVRGSGQVTIPITVSAGRELPWAQLSVYLMTADGTTTAARTCRTRRRGDRSAPTTR